MWENLLTLLWRKCLWYRNQSVDLHCKSMDWFERVEASNYYSLKKKKLHGTCYTVNLNRPPDWISNVFTFKIWKIFVIVLKLTSHDILLYLWPEDLLKSFSLLIVSIFKAFLNWFGQYLSFLNMFFKRICPVEKWRLFDITCLVIY